MPAPHGLARGLTNYGDADFSLYLRRSFAKSMGYSTEMLARPVVGIAQSRERLQQLPSPLPGADRGGQARRARGGRPADRLPDDLARRGVPEPDQHDVPQPDGDGRRGDDPRAADGRGGAASAAATRPCPRSSWARRRPTCRRSSSSPGRCCRCRITASGSAPAPTAGGSGRSTARAASTATEIEEIEGNLATTAGTCAVMGTASTMAAIAEALGMALPGHGRDSRRARRSPARGRGDAARARSRSRASGLRPSRIITEQVGRERAARAARRSAARPTRSSI